MKNFLEKLQKLGTVEVFEVKNNSLCLFLIGPVLFLYSYLNNNYGDENIKIEWAREVSALCFLGASILPFIFKKKVTLFYGWVVFLLMLMFTHYLLINLALNSFNIRLILGFYAFVFGSVLLFNNTTFINFFLVTVFLHLLQKLITSKMEGNDSRNSSNHILQSRCRTFRPNILEAQKIKQKDQESKNK